jgi:hypothetical protein
VIAYEYDVSCNDSVPLFPALANFYIHVCMYVLCVVGHLHTTGIFVLILIKRLEYKNDKYLVMLVLIS